MAYEDDEFDTYEEEEETGDYEPPEETAIPEQASYVQGDTGDDGYITDPGLLEQLGEPPKAEAAGDEEYISDPELLKQLGTPPSSYVEQEGKETKPEPGIWESFVGGLERGVSGLAQTGELALNKLLGRETETGTEERRLPAEDIKPSEALTSPISQGLPWLAQGLGRSAPAAAGAIATGGAGLPGIIAGSGLGQFLSDVGPKYRDEVSKGVPENKALMDSLASAGVSGIGTGASFGAFGLPGSWLTHLLMQPTLIQPTISGTEKAIQNYLAGKPLTEDVGEAALGGALGGLIPAGGHKAATLAHEPGVKPPAYTGEGAPGRYPLGTADPELPLRGGATRTPDQMRLPLEPPPGDPFRMPEPELPLRTPTGEQGQLPLPGAAGPTPAGRVGRELSPTETLPGTKPGELVTPPAPEIPGPGGRIAEQTEMPLVPPTGREPPGPPRPSGQGDLLPPTGEQGQLPFPHQEAAGTAGKTVAERESRGLPPVVNERGEVIRPGTERHGSPGSTAAVGTAESQPPPRVPKPGEPGWLTQARGPEDYGKDTPRRGAGGGMNVGPVDPTVAAGLKRTAIPETPPQHLDQRPVGELIRLARQEGLSPFMRQSLANELERRGIRRMPEPAGPEPANVGQQLRNREETARRATENAMPQRPIPENLPGPQKPGGITTPALPAPPVRGARPITDRPVTRGPIALPDRSLPQRPRTQTTSTAAPTTGRQFAPLREPSAPTPRPAPPSPAPTPKPVPKTIPHVTGTGRSVQLGVVSRHALRDIMAQHSGNTGLITKLTDFVRGKVSDRAGNIPVYVVADKDFYGRGVYAGRTGVKGYYSPMMEHIVVPERVITGPDKHLAPQIVLHEGLHAATYRAVQGSPQLQTALQGIMRDVVSKRSPQTSYGFTNVHEFITEGFTNPAFQNLLKDHTLSPAAATKFRQQMGSPVRNAWDAMVQTVRSIIGVPKGATNALEAMMRVSGKAMEMKPGSLRNTPLRVLAEREQPKPKLTSFERAKKMTNEQLREELARPDLKSVQRAVFNDALRARGEKPVAAAAAKTPTTPKTPIPIKAPPGRLSAITDRFKKSSNLTPAEKAIQDRIAPDKSWTDKMPTSLREATELIHRGYEGVWNSVHPMARAMARAERALGRKLETQEDFHRLARAIKGLGGKIETIYREGPFDPETRKVIGPALDPILEKIMRDKDGFNRYAIARRAIEQEGKGLKTGVPLKEANEIVAKGGKQWGQTFKEYQEFKSAMLRMGKHLIGEDGIAKIEELNKDHVPFYRALDPNSETGDMFRTGGGLTVKDPIEKYKGSERQIIDPMQSTLKNMAMIADLAEKNEVWRAMERTNKELIKAGKDPLWTKSRSDSPLQMTPEQRTRMLEAGIPEDMIEKMRFLDSKAYAPESKKIRYFENGKEQFRDVKEDIGRVAAGMDRAAWGVVTKVLGSPKRWLTAGATLNPDFPTKNLFRDQHTAMIQHDAKLRDMLKGDVYIPFYHAATSLERFFKPEVAAEFNKWMRNGGANAALVSFDRKLLSMEPRTVAGKVANVITHPWQIPGAVLDVLRGASEQLENATRFGSHLQNVKRGKDSPTSAFRARELTVDFPRMGNFTAVRFLAETIPFFNPQLQGLDRYVRSLKNNFPATMVKTIATITVPSVLLHMFNNQGDPRYDELPMWRKMLFWNIMTDKWRDVTPEQEKKLRVDSSNAWFRKDPQTGKTQYNEGTIWSWPKPFIEGQLAGSIPERLIEAFVLHKPDAMKHVNDSIIDAVLPNYIPQFMLPTVEGAMNYSTFLKRNLMSEGTERKPQEQQFTRNTTETAKTVAEAFRTVLGKEPAAQLGSPIIIDNYIRQLTGGLGDYAVKLITDPLLNLAKGKEPPPGPEKTMADIPIIKGFVSRFPTSGAESIQNFYDMRKDAQREKAGGDKFVDEGKSFADLLKAHRDGLEKVYADKKMSPEDKRTAIDVGTLLMIETARKGVEYMRKMNESAEKSRKRVKENAN